MILYSVALNRKHWHTVFGRERGNSRSQNSVHRGHHHQRTGSFLRCRVQQPLEFFLINSSRLPANTAPMVVNPVTFPPGRGRLSTSPVAMGSVTSIKTMGIVLVAFLAATAAGVLGAMITLTLRRTSSSA